ncbi:MAG: ABC transporter substrate-binding protein [Candidatus Melainabacteria bacterium]|nr:ABC transporter substrate-binding protein [Candidatus Melainabacteria bacterium]
MSKIKSKEKLTIAHSPDADDAFMFYALSKNIINNDSFEIKHVLKDIQTLNVESDSLKYDVQAISFFAYPFVEKEYQLLSCGGSLGYGYGPVVISKEKIKENDLQLLKNNIIAIPGEKTTAFLLLKLLIKDVKFIFVPFDKILEEVSCGKYPLGLIIHEGQLSYLKYGLHKVLDLGNWWLGKTNLPLPLGGNVVKRNFSEDKKKKINLLIKKSIAYALENKKEVIPYIAKYARDIEKDFNMVDKFVSMYVNQFTIDYGILGKLAIKKLYQMACRKGLISKIPKLDYVEF